MLDMIKTGCLLPLEKMEMLEKLEHERYSEFDWKCWKTTDFLLFWQEKLKFYFGPNDN